MRNRHGKKYGGRFGFFGWHTADEKLNAVAFFYRALMNGKGTLDKNELSKNKALIEGRLGDAVKAILKAQKKVNPQSPSPQSHPQSSN